MPDDIMTHLRTLAQGSDLSIAQVSRRSKIPYWTLYRALQNNGTLRVEQAEAAYEALTGQKLVTKVVVNEH